MHAHEPRAMGSFGTYNAHQLARSLVSNDVRNGAGQYGRLVREGFAPMTNNAGPTRQSLTDAIAENLVDAPSDYLWAAAEGAMFGGVHDRRIELETLASRWLPLLTAVATCCHPLLTSRVRSPVSAGGRLIWWAAWSRARRRERCGHERIHHRCDACL